MIPTLKELKELSSFDDTENLVTKGNNDGKVIKRDETDYKCELSQSEY